MNVGCISFFYVIFRLLALTVQSTQSSPIFQYSIESSINHNITYLTNSIIFMGKCVCAPGFTGDDCSSPILQNDDCDCKDRAFLTDPNYLHPDGLRCEMLCRFTPQIGIPNSIPTEWSWNQEVKQLHYYMNDMQHLNTPREAFVRLHEFIQDMREGFNDWDKLLHSGASSTDLGNVLEVGCGGLPTLSHIMDKHRSNVIIRSVTLIDPLIHEYMTIPTCPYKSGTFMHSNAKKNFKKSFPTTLINDTLESFVQNFHIDKDHRVLSLLSHNKKKEAHSSGASNLPQFDTIISTSVLPYACDAIAYLTSLHKLLKPNGVLIFYERWFENSAQSSKCRLVGFSNNIIQISRQGLDHFLSFFTKEPFLSSKQTKNQIRRSKDDCHWLDDETGYFAIVRKL